MKEGLRSSSKVSVKRGEDDLPLKSLISKKKGSCKKPKVAESKEEKKRLDFIFSDSESDDDLFTPSSRKTGFRSNGGSVGVKKEETVDSFERKGEIAGTDRKRLRSGDVKCEENGKCGRRMFDKVETERKSSRMDVFEFNEDDIVTIKKSKKEELYDEAGVVPDIESRILGSKLTPSGKQRVSCFDKNDCSLVGKKKGIVCRMAINNKKPCDQHETSEIRKSSRSLSSSDFPVYSEKKLLKKLCSSVPAKEKKNRSKSKETSVTNNSKAHPCKTDSGVTSVPLRSEHLVTEEKTSKPRSGALLREKQLIRDQIRKMLFDVGWRMDLRMRKSKLYEDAVYVSPKGLECWSITKAYYVHKKQCEVEEKFSFTPIPEEVLSRLFRITNKKKEREERKAKAKNGKKDCEVADIKTSTKKISAKVEIIIQKTKVMSKSMGIRKPSLVSKTQPLQGRKSMKHRGNALMVRSINNEKIMKENEFVPYNGKLNVLWWLIDSGSLPLNTKVKYMNKRRTRAMLEGWISEDGILCACCSKAFTVSNFEIHAGSKLCNPFQNIFVEKNMVSLFQCQLDAWNKQEEVERSSFYSVEVTVDDPNDDTCGICADGGDLICCDGCPSVFHQSCLDIQVLPSGDWHCLSCSCSFCGTARGSKDDVKVSNLLSCSMCEKQYHRSCFDQIHARSFDSNSSHVSFCGQKCKEMFGQLQKLFGVKNKLEDGFSWTLIQRSDLDSDKSLDKLRQRAECNSKLVVALTIMNECFLPIIDSRTGANVIHNVLYNCRSNFNRVNYSGFYTFVLERDDEMISAASIRIHGTRLAEMPFIGTRNVYRRQGMCRLLHNAIESTLCSLDVEKLIIPAISELLNTWTAVFGFMPLKEVHKQELRSMNLLVFPGIDLLEKSLINFAEGNVTNEPVVKAIKLNNNMEEVKKESALSLPVTSDTLASNESVLSTNSVSGVETVLEAPAVSMNDSPDRLASNESVLSTNSVSGVETVLEAPAVSMNDSPDRLISHASKKENTSCNSCLSQPECALPKSLLSCETPYDKPETEQNDTVVCKSRQSTTEGLVSSACAENARAAGDEPRLNSVDRISVQHKTDNVTEHEVAVNGSIPLATDGNNLQSFFDSNYQGLPDGEIKSVEISHSESDATLCEEVFNVSNECLDHYACVVKTEVGNASEPDVVGCLRCSAEDATCMHCFQASTENIVCHDTEDNKRLLTAVCKCSVQGFEETFVNHDSQLWQKIKCASDVSEMVGTIEIRKTLAATEHNLEVRGNCSVDCICKVVEQSLCTASKFNCLPSNTSNSVSDVADLPASEPIHHNSQNMLDDSSVAFSGDCSCKVVEQSLCTASKFNCLLSNTSSSVSNVFDLPTLDPIHHSSQNMLVDSSDAFSGDWRLHASAQCRLRDLGHGEFGVTSADHPRHQDFGQISVQNESIDADSEPISQPSSGNKRFIYSGLLNTLAAISTRAVDDVSSNDIKHNISSNDIDHNVYCPIAINSRAASEGNNANDIHGLEIEIAVIEKNGEPLDDRSKHDNSEVLVQSLHVV